MSDHFASGGPTQSVEPISSVKMEPVRIEVPSHMKGGPTRKPKPAYEKVKSEDPWEAGDRVDRDEYFYWAHKLAADFGYLPIDLVTTDDLTFCGDCESTFIPNDDYLCGECRAQI